MCDHHWVPYKLMPTIPEFMSRSEYPTYILSSQIYELTTTEVICVECFEIKLIKPKEKNPDGTVNSSS